MNDGSDPLTQRYKEICQQINQLSDKFGQPPPCLLAVSKKQTSEAIRQLYQLGQRHFGESYWQETEQKLNELGDLDIQWHFIGPLQSNKARQAVDLFDVIHTIDRPKIAQAISTEMRQQNKALGLFVQVNTGEEPQKAGVAPGDVDQFISDCRQMGLPIAGLMVIPPANEHPAPHFALLRKLAERNGLPKLSMGMSADYEIAVAMGATSVRVGSALFGARNKPA